MRGGRRGYFGERRAGARVLRCVLVAAAALLAAAPVVAAQERPSVVVDTTTPKLSERDGGGWDVDVTLINLTNEFLTLTSQPGDLGDRACSPKVPEMLPPAQMSDITVKVPDVCKLTGKKFEFEIDAETQAGDTVASVRFTAGPGPDPDTDSDSGWDAPVVLLLVLAGLAVLAGAFYAVRRS